MKSRAFAFWSIACLASMVACTAGCATITPPFDIAQRYAKSEVMVPMRDGVKLFASVYAPRDAGDSNRYPILMCRTPYSVAPYGTSEYRKDLGPSQQLAADGYIFVYQDVRGRFMSEGEYSNMRPQIDVKRGPSDIDESSDTYDTIDWLVKNIPHNNGRAGLWGISYPGFYAAVGVIDSHPALVASSPQAPIADWFVGDDFHHNGAFFLADAFGFFQAFRVRGEPTTEWPRPDLSYIGPDAYRFALAAGPLRRMTEKYYSKHRSFWDDLMAHGTYDEFWQSRNLLPHLNNVRSDVMTVGGWFDAEDLYGPLKIYESIERKNPGIQNTLVMGPWPHGGWARTPGDSLGDISFGAATSEFYRKEVEFPFFRDRLKGGNGAGPGSGGSAGSGGSPGSGCGTGFQPVSTGWKPVSDTGWKPVPQPNRSASSDEYYRPPEALVFVTGENTWQSLDAWPPRGLTERSVYFRPDGMLSLDGPPAAAARDFDEYVSDPAHPVPYQPEIAVRRSNTYIINDQRFASCRPDVLTYQTEPLAADLRLAGPITAELFVSTSGTDCDFVVKVIDVFPNDTPDPEPNPRELRMGGYQMLVRAEIMRAKFRDSLSEPKPMEPGVVTTVRYELRDVCHTFRAGHRLMVQVQSSWFPLADRNPQTFTDIYHADESAFQVTTNRLYRSVSYPSRLMVGVRDKM